MDNLQFKIFSAYNRHASLKRHFEIKRTRRLRRSLIAPADSSYWWNTAADIRGRIAWAWPSQIVRDLVGRIGDGVHTERHLVAPVPFALAQIFAQFGRWEVSFGMRDRDKTSDICLAPRSLINARWPCLDRLPPCYKDNLNVHIYSSYYGHAAWKLYTSTFTMPKTALLHGQSTF